MKSKLTHEIIRTNTLSVAQKETVFQLWNDEYPQQLGFSTLADFENYLRILAKPTHYFVCNKDEKILAWAFVFEREKERWFAIIIDGSKQRNGLGTQLLDALKEEEAMLNGWVTEHDNYVLKNGASYLSPKEFYLKNGFTFCGGTRLETELLSAIKIKWKLPKNNI